MHRLILLPLALLATPALPADLACEGPFAADSSEARLVELYGRENVVTGEVPGPEGMPIIATTLFPNDPERAMQFHWWDEAAHQRLAYVIIPEADVAPNGLRPGLTIAEVEALNGGPFQLTGFWWDFGGYANFEGGILGEPSAGGCLVSARFEPTDLPAGIDVDAIAGDSFISSSEPLLAIVGARVSEVSLSYPALSDPED